jgi:hypothetical protein
MEYVDFVKNEYEKVETTTQPCFTFTDVTKKCCTRTNSQATLHSLSKNDTVYSYYNLLNSYINVCILII